MDSTPPPRPAIFVSAALDTDLTAISNVLQDSSFTSVHSVDLPTTALGDALRSALQSCVGMVALIGSELPAGILVEIGAAIGVGLPVVIVAEGRTDVANLPAAVRGLPIIVLGGADRALVGQRFAQAFAAGAAGIASTPTAADSRTDSYVASLRSREWADETERLVAEAFATKGNRVVPQVPANKVGHVDLAVWISQLAEPQYNPILVEVAGRQANVEQKVEQLRGYLTAANALLGIVVVPHEIEPIWNIRDGRAIVAVGLNWLQEASSEDLVRLLTHGRNQLFHSLP